MDTKKRNIRLYSIHVRLSEREKRMLERIAEKEEVSLSEALRLALRKYYDETIKEKNSSIQ